MFFGCWNRSGQDPETRKAPAGRIEAVLAWATVDGHRTGIILRGGPETCGNFCPRLTAWQRRTIQPAVQIEDAPRWFAAIKKDREGMGARGLEFAALTATRSQRYGAQGGMKSTWPQAFGRYPPNE
ncbi:MAG: hypothetical protein R3D81_14905 [Thalassovita sp.]